MPDSPERGPLTAKIALHCKLVFTTEDTESTGKFLFTRFVSGHGFTRAERCAKNDGL
jgi:hypothetical protein